MRVYVIDAYDIKSKDDKGFSDPYIKIKLGREEIDLRDKFIQDSTHPKFYEFFDIKTYLPGPSTLSVQIWDYDAYSIYDDMIGETKLELEDRFFSAEWRKKFITEKNK